VGGALADINKVNTVELVGGSRGGVCNQSSSDDDDDFRNIAFPQDDALQKAFADYQTQQVTNSFVDQFGFNEDDFAEQEETIGSPFSDRISSINFDLNMIEDNPTSAALFEQACNDRIRQFDSADSDDELEITFSQISDHRHSSAIPRPGERGGNARTSAVTSSRRDSYEDEDEEDFEQEIEEDEGSEGEAEGSTDSEEELDSPRLIIQTGRLSSPLGKTTKAPSGSSSHESKPATRLPGLGLDLSSLSDDTSDDIGTSVDESSESSGLLAPRSTDHQRSKSPLPRRSTPELPVCVDEIELDFAVMSLEDEKINRLGGSSPRATVNGLQHPPTSPRKDKTSVGSLAGQANVHSTTNDSNKITDTNSKACAPHETSNCEHDTTAVCQAEEVSGEKDERKDKVGETNDGDLCVPVASKLGDLRNTSQNTTLIPSTIQSTTVNHTGAL